MKITIKPRNFCQRWWQDTYPVFQRNPSLAGDMTNCDITSPNYLSQGKGTAVLTNGSQTGAITTLLKGMNKTAVTDDAAYGTGGALLQQFSATAVTNAGIWPHTITGTGTITGEDVLHYYGKLYYSYNDSNTPSGDVGTYDLSTTFTDSHFVTGLSGTALQNAPHQMCAGGSRVFIANGKYIAEIDISDATATQDALTLYPDDIISSIVWYNDKVYAAVNNPNITGANSNSSFIYAWNYYDDNYEGEPIKVNGKIGALYVKNGIIFVWYKSRIGASNINTFGYVGQNRVIPLATFDGDCPEYYQVGERGDYVMWLSGSLVYLYGSLNEQSVGLEQFMTSSHATGGGISSPFGEIVVSSYSGSDYALSKESGLTVSSNWKSLVFNVANGQNLCQLDDITVFTEELASGAKMDTVLRYNSGTESMNLDQLAYSSSKPIRHIIGKRNLPRVSDFRLELSFANGSATNPTKVKQIEINGHLILNK